MDRLEANEGSKLVGELSEILPDGGVKGHSQHLADKCLKVDETEHCHSILRNEERLTKKELIDNIKPEITKNSNFSLHNGAPSVSLASIIHNNMDSTIEKTKNEDVSYNVTERTKKEKFNSIIQQKKDSVKNKEKLKMEKDTIKDELDYNTKERKRCSEDMNDNPFKKIIREMTTKKPYEGIENENLTISNHSNQRRQNLKNQVPQPPQPETKNQSKISDNLTPILLTKGVKRSLSPPLDWPNEKKLKITPLDTKKQPPADESCKDDCVNKHNGLKSALMLVRNKSSKKSVSWKEDSDLVQVSYFEHDATERVNVNRTFKARKMRKRDVKRQNLIAVRKLTNVFMEPKTAWRNLDNSLLIDIPEEPGKAKIEPGSNSLEKIKQTVREKSVLEAIYLTKNMIPDSPEEPDEMEIFPFYEPLNIPLEDMSGDVPIIYDYVGIPWPESAGGQPPIVEKMQQRHSLVMPPNNMTGMIPPKNNVYKTPTNQMMMNNRLFMGEQTPQRAQFSQQQRFPPQHLIQEVQWTGPPRPPVQHYQHFNLRQSTINHGPSHFESYGGAGVRGHTRWANYPRGGNRNSYRGKMNRDRQSGNRGGPFNFRGAHSGYGRSLRLCKYFAKQGFCKNYYCAFFHPKN